MHWVFDLSIWSFFCQRLYHGLPSRPESITAVCYGVASCIRIKSCLPRLSNIIFIILTNGVGSNNSKIKLLIHFCSGFIQIIGLIIYPKMKFSLLIIAKVFCNVIFSILWESSHGYLLCTLETFALPLDFSLLQN